MSGTKIKICGIKSIDTANAAIDASADYLGFVFAPSARQISPENASKIAKSLPSTTALVGVFVNESVENIHRIAKDVGLTHIQLHGDEPPEYCQRLQMPVIKAWRVYEGFDFRELPKWEAEFFLFDSFSKDSRGGSGIRFDLNLLKGRNLYRPFFIAGGLSPENVGAAIQESRPFGVDVSGGVETNGEKDTAKIRLFIQSVRNASTHHS